MVHDQSWYDEIIDQMERCETDDVWQLELAVLSWHVAQQGLHTDHPLWGETYDS